MGEVLEEVLQKRGRALEEKRSQRQRAKKRQAKAGARHDIVIKSYKTCTAEGVEKLRHYGALSNREKALRNIVQFRGADPRNEECILETNRIRVDMEEDLGSIRKMIESDLCISCCSCGKDVMKDQVIVKEKEKCKEWANKVLGGRLYEGEVVGLEDKVSKVANFCKVCIRLLENGKGSKYGLQNGWNFDTKLPEALKKLTKHESLLISLRLPYVWVTRDRGFG